jgi:hypothetical protein
MKRIKNDNKYPAVFAETIGETVSSPGPVALFFFEKN